MKKLILVLVFLASVNGTFAQLTLVLEKIGTPRRYAFHLGDDMKIQTIKLNQIHKSYLWNLTDSTMTIGPRTVVPLSDVAAVYKNHHFPKIMSKFLIIMGGGYIVLDAFNNIINHDQVFNSQTLIIGGSILLAGVAIIPFWQTKHKIGIKWKLKIMEINLE
ncbi:MAG: hypothetical protein NTW10_09545 [Bacteroidetes bacterium]|nr:hypothetical protein [Bacteroidota bacterium]